jgi:hypothetical protein
MEEYLSPHSGSAAPLVWLLRCAIGTVDHFTLVMLCDLDREEVTHATSTMPMALAIARVCLEGLVQPSLELTVLDPCGPWIMFMEL